MASEELSQDDINNLLNGGEEENQEEATKEEPKEENIEQQPTDKEEDEIKSILKEFSNALNTSLEEVLKTLFSLSIVSKFIDLNIKEKDDIQFEDGVFFTCKITVDSQDKACFAYIKKEFASILSDLMLMGPGEAKEQLEPDDLDALKEMLSQVFGNFQTSFKEILGQDITIEIEDVKEEPVEIEDTKYYTMEFDIAIPNIKNDVIYFFAKKDAIDEIFKEEEPQQEDVPFDDVEDTEIQDEEQTIITKRNAPDNLDIILDIDLDVKIRIGEKQILIKDLLDLREGSIIELEKSIDEPMDVLINNKVVAQGVVVVVGGRFGVKITNIDTKEERIKSLGE